MRIPKKLKILNQMSSKRKMKIYDQSKYKFTRF